MSSTATLPQLLCRHAEATPDRTAMREKDRGIWQPYSWRRYRQEVHDFALGLAAGGFGRGDKLSVIGENRPRLYFAQLAAMSLGGVAVPVYQDAIAGELAYVLDHAETSVVVAENQEQVDKILSLKDRLPRLQRLVYDDPRGLRDYGDPLLQDFESVAAAGREFGAAHPGFFEAAVAAGDPAEVALISYTSGTTSRPKGVMLSPANLLVPAASFAALEGLRQSDEHISYLPMAWIGNSLFSMALHLQIGFTINFPEKPETLERDTRELGPTIALAPPRLWENALARMLVMAADASPLKRRVFDYFRGVAERAEGCVAVGRPLPAALRLLRACGDFLVYAPLRDRLGRARTRHA
jgi:long-chain acyl-CoA synthetase